MKDKDHIIYLIILAVFCALASVSVYLATKSIMLHDEREAKSVLLLVIVAVLSVINVTVFIVRTARKNKQMDK